MDDPANEVSGMDDPPNDVSGKDDPPNPLVQDLAKGLPDSDPRRVRTMAAEDAALAFAGSSDVSKTVRFEGYFGAIVSHDEKRWRVLYVDLEGHTWLLVEADGIVAHKTIQDSTWPYDRDVIWVKAGAAVGICQGAQSVQAQFLTGDFTRAGDFEAPPTGGTPTPATGPFCQPSVGCCYGPRSR
jgi:hypothetical protein